MYLYKHTYENIPITQLDTLPSAYTEAPHTYTNYYSLHSTHTYKHTSTHAHL